MNLGQKVSSILVCASFLCGLPAFLSVSQNQFPANKFNGLAPHRQLSENVFSGAVFAQGMSQAQRHAALEARQIADSELYEQMERVSRWMDQYATWNQKFPDPGDETNWARQQMNALVPNNPYSGDSCS